MFISRKKKFLTSFIAGSLSYQNKTLRLQPANLLGYWTLGEPSGNVVRDISGNGYNTISSGTIAGQTGIGDGGLSRFFNGTADSINCQVGTLANVFNKNEGTLSLWNKVNSVSVWTDGNPRRTIYIQTDTNNLVSMYKSNGNNNYIYYYRVNSTDELIILDTNNTNWIHSAITWSKTNDQVIAYVNGIQTGNIQTNLNTWAAGALNKIILGNIDNNSSQSWHGWLAHFTIWNAALSPSKILQLATI